MEKLPDSKRRPIETYIAEFFPEAIITDGDIFSRNSGFNVLQILYLSETITTKTTRQALSVVVEHRKQEIELQGKQDLFQQ